MTESPGSPNVTVVASTPLRFALVAIGLVCVGLAVIGLFLPGLPTTPFLLLAAAAFARSSHRLHDRLLRNRVFGPLIRDWQANRSVSRRAKAAAVGSILLVGGPSVWLAVSDDRARVGLALIMLTVIVWIVSRPSTAIPRRPDQSTR